MLTEPREASLRSSTFALVAGQPPRIDLTTLFHGDPHPISTQGIYARRGQLLEYCVAAPGRPRPTAFATQPGDEQTLVTLKYSKGG